MSFLINQDGVVYEQDLGKDTLLIVSETTAFNPDRQLEEREGPCQGSIALAGIRKEVGVPR